MTNASDPALLGWAAKHPVESPAEISLCPPEDRNRVQEYSGTRHTIRRSLRLIKDIAAGLERMASNAN